MLAAQANRLLDRETYALVLIDLCAKLMLLGLHANSIVSNQRMNFIVLNVLVLVVIELVDVLVNDLLR